MAAGQEVRLRLRSRIERFDFYDRAKQAFAVLMTGETVKYGNIILRKGVTGMIQK